MLRVAEQIEPQRQPLDEVKPVIVSELRSAAEREALDALVASVRARSAAGETIEAIANDLGYQWKVELGATRTGSLLPRAVLDKAFTMSSEEQAAIDATPLPGLGYALVQLARVTPGSLNAVSEAQANVLARQTTSEFQRATMTEFTNSLRASAEIITR
jgi:peptidyl-prolyl cis-trans isomerase D